jgi:hypothetical protein
MPPIPNNVVRVSLVWSPGSGWPSEGAVNTFHVVPQDNTGTPAPDAQYIADQIAAKLTTAWPDLSPQISSAAQVTAIKTYLLNTSNRAIAAGVHAFSAGTLAGGSSSSMMPPECAICISEYAYPPGGFAPRKGTQRGRMYVPYFTTGALSTSGKVQSSVASAHAQAWAAFFNAVNTVESHSGATNPIGVVILSVAAGNTYEVLHVSVDDHWDAQRRRQHQDVPVQHVFDVTAW